ncbi:hypothetical protein HDV02_004984 [Globomyces sp. JEL0801]|nr:hypothetical protein HDV02_004984 [Globomyces sp. JEL0801]
MKSSSSNDTEFDEYVASLLLNQYSKLPTSGGLPYSTTQVSTPPSKLLNTNKRFLMNTIKNTSSYNEQLKKQELDEKMKREERIREKLEADKRKAKIKKKKSKPKDNDKTANSLEANTALRLERLRESNIIDTEPKAEWYSKLGALVNHSKLKKKPKSKPKTAISAMEALFGNDVDQGVYGPRPGKPAHGLIGPLPVQPIIEEATPNVYLPEKCPW